MKSLPFLFFFLFSVSLLAQTEIENKVADFPKHFNSTEEIAKKIETQFSSDYKKAKAAYVWIAKNISYDTKSVGKAKSIQFSYRTEEELEQKKKQFRKDLSKKCLRRKKGLCEEYSTLFQELCELMNIKCEIVTGTARRFISEIGKNNLPANHAWNLIHIGKDKIVADVTWAAGSVDYQKMKFRKQYSASYFDSDPEKFALKHFPDDEKYLLLNRNFTKADFVSQVIPFTPYLDSKLELLTPKQGILSLKKGKEFTFQFRNLPKQSEFAYHFGKEKYGQKVKLSHSKNRASFTITPTKRGKDELIIYLNNQALLGYKVVVK